MDFTPKKEKIIGCLIFTGCLLLVFLIMILFSQSSKSGDNSPDYFIIWYALPLVYWYPCNNRAQRAHNIFYICGYYINRQLLFIFSYYLQSPSTLYKLFFVIFIYCQCRYIAIIKLCYIAMYDFIGRYNSIVNDIYLLIDRLQ